MGERENGREKEGRGEEGNVLLRTERKGTGVESMGWDSYLLGVLKAHCCFCNAVHLRYGAGGGKADRTGSGDTATPVGVIADTAPHFTKSRICPCSLLSYLLWKSGGRVVKLS